MQGAPPLAPPELDLRHCFSRMPLPEPCSETPSETTRTPPKPKLLPRSCPDPHVQRHGDRPTAVLSSPLARHPHHRMGSVARLATCPLGPTFVHLLKASSCPGCHLFSCDQNEPCPVPGPRRLPLPPGFLQPPLTSPLPEFLVYIGAWLYRGP